MELACCETQKQNAMKNDKMVAALKKVFVPVLKERGFNGSFPHFRRILNDRIDLLTLQFDRWGCGFVVEIATCDPGGLTTHWGKRIPPNKVTAWDLNPNRRHRPGSSSPKEDGHWFRFDDGTSVDTLADSVVMYLEEADRWWDSRSHNS
jgi:hypothetical protein